MLADQGGDITECDICSGLSFSHVADNSLVFVDIMLYSASRVANSPLVFVDIMLYSASRVANSPLVFFYAVG